MLIRSLASAWAYLAEVPAVEADSTTDEWLRRLAPAGPDEVASAAAAGPPELVVAAVRTLLSRARASAGSPDDEVTPFTSGALLAGIVARGHGTDFEGGHLAEAHGRFLMGLEKHLAAPTIAHRHYELARLAYLNANSRALTRLAALASATVKRSLLAEADGAEVHEALYELRQDGPTTVEVLQESLGPYVELATWIARFKSGSPVAFENVVDLEGAEMLRAAALDSWEQLETAMTLARLADTVGLGGTDSSTRQRLAERLSLRRRWHDAAGILAELHAEDPGDADVLQKLATALNELDQWPRARELLIGAMHDPPVSSDVPVLRQLVLLAYSAREEDAPMWRDRLVALDPDADPMAGLLPPDASELCVGLMATFRDGNLQIDPDLLELPGDEQTAHMSAAMVAGSPDGDTILHQLLEQDPPLAQRVLALLGLRAVSPERARAEEHFNGAEEDFRARRFEEAQRGYEAALELDPQYVEAATYLGDTWYRRGDFHIAQAFFEESLAIQPTAEAYRYLGDSLLHGGHGAARARAAYRQALKINPGYAGARATLAALEAPADDPRPEEKSWSADDLPIAPAQGTTIEAPPRLAPQSPDTTTASSSLAEALESTGRVGDGVLAGYVRMMGDKGAGFVEAIDDDERFAAWLAAAGSEEIVRALMLAVTVSFQYQVKDRDAARGGLWVRRQLSMAEVLPTEYGPSDDPMQLGRDRHLADALSSLGDVREDEGLLGETRSLYESALAHLDAEDIARERAGLVGEAEFDRLFSSTSVRSNVLARLASVCRRLGDEDAANRHGRAARDLDEARPTTEAEVDAFVGGGHAALHDGRLNDALGSFQHALYMTQDEDPDPLVPRTITKALNGLGDGYVAVGAIRAALACFDRARSLNERTGNSDRLAFDHRAIARVLEVRPTLGSDGFGDARHHLEQALKYASVPDTVGDALTWTDSDGERFRITSPDRSWPTLLQLASCLSGVGDDSAAVGFLEIATQLADAVRAGVVEEQQRIAVRREQVRAFADLTSARVRLALQGGPDSGTHARAAWVANESVRARTFLDALGDVPLRPPPNVSRRLVDRERELLGRRQSLRVSGRGDVGFWDDYREVTDELDALWAHFRDAHPTAEGYIEIRQAVPADPDDLTEILQRDGRPIVLADLVRIDDGTLGVIALRADHAEPLVMTLPADLPRLDRFIGQNFGSAGSVRELAEDMEDLFQFELSSVGRLLTSVCDPHDVLVVSPFGRLHHVPLGALCPGGQPLLERNPLALLPSSSLLRALRSAAHKEPAVPAAVFGDPTGDLAGARSEALEVAQRFRVKAALGPEATIGAVTDALIRSGVVHVAAHAAFDSDDALGSGVVLSDGLLTARGIISLRAPALSLVTLSACETGVSQTDAAEELVGLTRALMFAGADAIVVSLWKVPDASTLEVMQGFYEGIIGEKRQPTVDALRSAVLAARDRYGPTRFDTWAGFQLVGDWR